MLKCLECEKTSEHEREEHCWESIKVGWKTGIKENVDNTCHCITCLTTQEQQIYLIVTHSLVFNLPFDMPGPDQLFTISGFTNDTPLSGNCCMFSLATCRSPSVAGGIESIRLLTRGCAVCLLFLVTTSIGVQRAAAITGI